MKEEIHQGILELQSNMSSSENLIFKDVELIRDNDSGFSGGSESLFSESEESEVHESTNIQFEPSENQKRDLLTKLRQLIVEKNFPDDFYNLSTLEQKNWLRNQFKLEAQALPDTLTDAMFGIFFEVDFKGYPDEKPDWLDMDKFRKGQRFARDNIFGLSYAQLLSLFILFSFEDGLKPLILTGNSSTPYTSFKRYLSTFIRLRNWFTEDPWIKGSAAYNDIQMVRKMHANVRKRLERTPNENIDAAANIENPYCPMRDILLRDFQSTCPAPAPGQCPYTWFRSPEMVPLRPKALNQGDMSLTQFGFVGLMILYPKSFGAHYATEEDLEAFCHTWMALGYLLGLENEFNICRGSLADVRQRCRDFLELWVKPNFRELTPENEHMMRCVVEGLEYYFPGVTYESCVLYLSELMNLHTPRLYASLTYVSWVRHNLIKSFFYYTSRVPGLMTLMNKKLNASLDKAVNFSSEKHEELKKKSEETLRKTIDS